MFRYLAMGALLMAVMVLPVVTYGRFDPTRLIYMAMGVTRQIDGEVVPGRGLAPMPVVPGRSEPAKASPDAPPLKDTPLAHVFKYDGMWKGDDRVLDADQGMPVFRDAVFAGAAKSTEAEVPLIVAHHPLLNDCTGLSPAAPGEAVALVRGGARMKAGVMRQDESAMRALVTDYLEDLRKPRTWRSTLDPAAIKGQIFDAYEVAVTRKDVPLVLVLSGAMREPRIWNLQIAPGVRLARVVLLGGELDGVAHLPEGVPVEAIGRAALAECGAREAYPHSEISLLHQNYARGMLGEREYTEIQEEARTAYEAWAAWFAARYGAEPMAVSYGLDVGMGVLIGPLPATPETRLPWAPLAGAPVSLTEGAAVLTAGPDGVAALAAQIEARARAIAGPAFERLEATPLRASGMGI